MALEEKILDMLVSINTTVNNISVRMDRMESHMSKMDHLANIQNDDIITLVKTTSEIKHNVIRVQKDVLYLVERTADNSKQLLGLVK